METPKNNKNSLFAGMFPDNEPSPVPVQRPTAVDEQVAALNRKIELMERNIVCQLEKKLAEAPTPQPPSPAIPDVISKITEMETRFREFQEKFLMGAAQMKNIEESKISARREIEELLKVVREQQKYTELDRQMHDQLQKSWARVEELEKRMMEVYISASKKADAPPAPVFSQEKLVAGLRKAVDAGLEVRIKALEDKLLEATQRQAASPRAVEAVTAAVAASLEARFNLLAEEASKVSSEREPVWSEAFRGAKEEFRKEALEAVRQGFSEAGGVFERHLTTALLEGRDRLDTMARLLAERLGQLDTASRENVAKVETLVAQLCTENGSVMTWLSDALAGLERNVQAGIREAAISATQQNRTELRRIHEACSLSVSNAAMLGRADKILSDIDGRIEAMLAGVRKFIKNLEPVKLDSLLGVSGTIVRRSFDDLKSLAEGLERDRAVFAELKNGISANIAKYSGGEGK